MQRMLFLDDMSDGFTGAGPCIRRPSWVAHDGLAGLGDGRIRASLVAMTGLGVMLEGARR